jgi:hypothetical protein
LPYQGRRNQDYQKETRIAGRPFQKIIGREGKNIFGK